MSVALLNDLSLVWLLLSPAQSFVMKYVYQWLVVSIDKTWKQHSWRQKWYPIFDSLRLCLSKKDKTNVDTNNALSLIRVFNNAKFHTSESV